MDTMMSARKILLVRELRGMAMRLGSRLQTVDLSSVEYADISRLAFECLTVAANLQAFADVPAISQFPTRQRELVATWAAESHLPYTEAETVCHENL